MATLEQLLKGNMSPAHLRQERVKKMVALRTATGRHVIVIAADYTKAAPAPGAMMHHEDLPLVASIVETVPAGADVDVFLHSGGGFAEIAEKIATILGDRFNSVRFVVPVLAGSAATILALNGDDLAMSPTSSLRPIDPQFNVNGKTYPAQALIEGVEKIVGQSKGGQINPAHVAILQGVSPAELQAAEETSELSRQLARTGLENGMLSGTKDAAKQAAAIAKALCDHQKWLTHGRLISMSQLVGLGLPIIDFSQEAWGPAAQELSDLIIVTFQSNIVKLFETEGSDLAKRINLTAPGVGPGGGPGLPFPDPKAATNVDVDYVCPTCHSQIPLQIRLDKSVQLNPARIAYPANDRMKCPSCAADLDLKAVRMQAEQITGKKLVAWEAPKPRPTKKGGRRR